MIVSLDKAMKAMWGSDYACPGYKVRPAVTCIERETSDEGQYLRSVIMLTKADEANLKLGETQTYGDPKKDGFSIRWPYRAKHGDEVDEVRSPMPGFEKWLESQGRACQSEVHQCRQNQQGSCSASEFATLKRQLELKPAQATPGTTGKQRSTRST